MLYVVQMPQHHQRILYVMQMSQHHQRILMRSANTAALSAYSICSTNAAAPSAYRNMYKTKRPGIVRDSLTVLSLWENIHTVMEIQRRYWFWWVFFKFKC